MARKVALFVFAFLLSLPGVAGARELRIAFDAGDGSARSFDAPDEVPAAMRRAVEGATGGELRENEERFLGFVEEAARERQDDWAGGGARAGGNHDLDWLAFVLGLVPGFGLGHFAIAHDSPGGIRWLIIDAIFLAIWIVLDVAVSAAYPATWVCCDPYGRPYYTGGGWGLWWLLFDLFLPVGWIVEHVFQGLSAYRAASGRNLFGESRPPASAGTLAVEPVRSSPNLFAWGF